MLPYPDDSLAIEEAIFDERVARRRKQKKIKIIVARKDTPEQLHTQEDEIDQEVDIKIEDDDADDWKVDHTDIVPEESQVVTKTEDIEERDEPPVSIRVVNENGPFSTILNTDSIKITQTLITGPYKVRQYFLSGPDGNIIGSFALFISNPDINSAPNGPNDMFRQLELTDIGLKRNPAAIPGRRYFLSF